MTKLRDRVLWAFTKTMWATSAAAWWMYVEQAHSAVKF